MTEGKPSKKRRIPLAILNIVKEGDPILRKTSREEIGRAHV